VTTVIAVYNSEGCVGRCDAKCHNATRLPDCDCICGGRLHGVGAANAVAVNTERIDPDGELRRAFAQAHGFDPDELRLEHAQGALF
jgi:orotate phosphoribosyltransferase